MTGKPDCLGGIALDFAGIPQRSMKIFRMNTRVWVSGTARQAGTVF